MNTSQNAPKNTDKKGAKAEELKTEHPLSEKDEVKAAEDKTAKLLKNKPQTGDGKKS